jgi:carnosine N-methyltransferase
MIADPVFGDMLKDEPRQAQANGTSEDSEREHTHDHSHGRVGRKGDRDTAQEKVRSTLRSFVRDWSEAGAHEREACYTPCLEALERRFLIRGERGGRKVLIPGCGLGRLAMEVAARGKLLPLVLSSLRMTRLIFYRFCGSSKRV